MTELPMPDAAEIDHRIDAAFDEFIAAGYAPWLVARIGDGLDSTEPFAAKLPGNALDVPRLESGIFPSTLGDGSAWFLPDFVLSADSDPAFGFAAVQTGEVAEDGGPYNRATLTMSLRSIVPKDLAAYPAAQHVRQVPDMRVGLTLNVPVTTRDGATVTQAVPGTATAGPGGGYVATFNLTGSMVEAAYEHLTHRGEAGLEVTCTYTGYQTAIVTIPDVGFPIHGPVFRGYQFEVLGDGGRTPVSIPVSVDARPGSYRFFPVTARFSRTVAIGLAFDTDAYRGRFTITADGMTRPIIDADDLGDFAHPRSEYRELTTLGDVAAKYPSLRRLYFGQVSGTVVAVPAAYGILRNPQGLLAACDSVVDDSPASITGCRFHFTFTVFPMADPVDLARLRADILAIPEAQGRSLRVALPGGLDSRYPSSLDGFPAAKTVIADGSESAVQVGIDIADDEATPATTNVNLFLQQLASAGPAPLFGSVAVRLDDVFPQPVRTQLVLSLRQTVGRGDLTTSFQSEGDRNLPTVRVANEGPFDLVLHRFAVVLGSQVTVASLNDQVLGAGKTTALPIVFYEAVEVSCGLVVPTPVPKAAMSKYVAFHTHTVQQVQHPLTVNAAGLNFAGITAIDVQITLAASPATPVPAMTLSPSHPVDFVHVMVPVDSAVTGLDATVALTLTTAAGKRTVTVSHDFVEEPILILTQSRIA